MSSDPSDPFEAAEPPPDIAEALASSRGRRGGFGAPLLYVPTIGSTSDVAARLAAGGAPEGTTVVAEAQTAGRGRLGRTWFSPQGAGLYVSVVIRPDAPRRAGIGRTAGAGPGLPAVLTLAAGVALAEAIRETTGLAAEIKWPNDLVFERRKLAGILAEASAQGAELDYVILGVGVNIRPVTYPPDVAQRATSIEAELGRAIDRGVLLAKALENLSACREALRRGEVAGVLERWRRLSPSAVGARVEWRTPGGAVRGRTAGLDADGALLVDRDGRVERVVAGEVIWT
ncbi:MAG: biotin--[acetyl-CoA-carboxylase] ligase [Vicinamibacterales bacterium]|nr:biotin--[acetyl-CoA-carboxylase] ligase [Vicinamibacterales bacterium]